MQTEEGPELVALRNDFHAALRHSEHNRAIINLMQRLDAQLALYDSSTGGSADDRTLSEAG